MAKKLVGSLKLQVPAGQANPSPPVGPALGQRGINIMEFCKAFNAKTQDMEPGAPCPTVIQYYQDKSFTMEIKTPPASYYLKKAAKLKSGANNPGKETAGSVTVAQVKEIAEAKMKDLNANDIDAAMQIILGSARSMGIEANSKTKFDETVEIAMNLGVDPRHADQMVRGVVGLPNGTGKDVRVAVFARGPKAEEAQAAGADIVGAEDLMETIQGGKIDFDRCIATPDMMPIVGRLGKVLGPRNLMPNPKVGTVTMDVADAVKAAKGGEVQFKAEKAGVVHAGVGKASFDEAKLVENVKAFVDAVAKAKPSGAKGAYIKKVSLSSSMGPGVTVSIESATGN
eukprot:g1703.t1